MLYVPYALKNVVMAITYWMAVIAVLALYGEIVVHALQLLPIPDHVLYMLSLSLLLHNMCHIRVSVPEYSIIIHVAIIHVMHVIYIVIAPPMCDDVPDHHIDIEYIPAKHSIGGTDVPVYI